MNSIRRQRQRAWLSSTERMQRCCWCLVPTILESGPDGQPTALTATLEHPRSRLHPKGRSRLRETRLSHHVCNLTANRIETRAAVGGAQGQRDIDWVASVVAAHEVDGIPAMRQVIARLVELVSGAGVVVPAPLSVVVSGRPEEGW